MRVFLTGANGFAGSHLVDGLLAAGHQVTGLVYGKGYEVVHPAFQAVEGNLLDLGMMKQVVADSRPEIIYHLAGQPLTAGSWANPTQTIMVNTGGTINVLEAAVAFGRPRVVVVTSAEIYGVIRPEQLPISERSQPNPNHPYGVSKWAAGQMIRLYWQRYQLPVIEARPFNHIGPRQALGFVVPDFASQLAAMKLGQQSAILSVGNLSAERDFTDVRDVVRAYMALAEQGHPGEAYIICSGQPVKIHYLLNVLIELSGVNVEVVYDPQRLRPSEMPTLYGSYRRIQRHTGWKPQLHLRQSLADAFQDWLEKLQR